jgi:hypothetical protein
MMPPPRDSVPVFEFCGAPEQRCLLDLIQQENPRVPGDHPVPELQALLRALERMWGGESVQERTAPPELLSSLATYTTYAHRIPEDAERWHSGAAHDVHPILQGLIKSVVLAITDGSVVKHDYDGVYLDRFRLPQWCYDEIGQDEQA